MFFYSPFGENSQKKEKKEHCMEPDWVHKSGPEFLEFEKI